MLCDVTLRRIERQSAVYFWCFSFNKQKEMERKCPISVTLVNGRAGFI